MAQDAVEVDPQHYKVGLENAHVRVVATPYGWWQGCQVLGLPGYEPFGPEGANANLLIPSEAIDPISGSVPHRSQRCRVRKATVPTSTVASGVQST